MAPHLQDFKTVYSVYLILSTLRNVPVVFSLENRIMFMHKTHLIPYECQVALCACGQEAQATKLPVAAFRVKVSLLSEDQAQLQRHEICP